MSLLSYLLLPLSGLILFITYNLFFILYITIVTYMKETKIKMDEEKRTFRVKRSAM